MNSILNRKTLLFPKRFLCTLFILELSEQNSCMKGFYYFFKDEIKFEQTFQLNC